MTDNEINIRETITIQHTIDVLNRALKRDSDAVRTLIMLRVLCNRELGTDPTIQCMVSRSPNGDQCHVSILGVLNGLFGVDDAGWGPIAANFKLVCTKGCALPKNTPMKIGGLCPTCRATGEAGVVDFGPITHFFRRDKKEETDEGKDQDSKIDPTASAVG